jgi:hypothetical protein
VSRRRAALERIAYGEGTTPTERLRALELLRELEPVESPPLPVDLIAMDERSLDEVLDGLLAEPIIEAATTGTGWPQLGALIREEVERRARELADADAIDRRVEERARELAAELYVREGFESIAEALERVPDDTERTEGTNEAPEPPAAVSGLETLPAVAFPDELPPRKRARRRRFA